MCERYLDPGRSPACVWRVKVDSEKVTCVVCGWVIRAKCDRKRSPAWRVGECERRNEDTESGRLRGVWVGVKGEYGHPSCHLRGVWVGGKIEHGHRKCHLRGVWVGAKSENMDTEGVTCVACGWV